MASVQLRGVSKAFGPTVALHPFDLDVPAGDRLAILGPSGSGKSTLLRLVAGLDEPDAGDVYLNGERVTAVPPHRRGVAFVPQRPALYPHLTVGENLAVPLRYGAGGLPPAESAGRLRVSHLLDRYPHQLSGGERQRVALARAAVRAAGVWLLDEPFAPLDPAFRSDFRHDLHLLLESTGATILLVTHDPIDALALGRRVGVLGDGRLEQLGTAEELRRRPATRFVAAALGQSSFLDGQPVGGRAGGGDPAAATFVAAGGLVEVPVPGFVRRHLDRHPAYNLTLGFRPEDVTTRPSGEGTGWPVVSAEPVGSGWVLTVARGSTRVRVGWPSGSPPPVGDPVHWTLPPAAGIWFDAGGRRIEDD